MMGSVPNKPWSAGGDWWLEGVLMVELRLRDEIVGYLYPDRAESTAAQLNRDEDGA